MKRVAKWKNLLLLALVVVIAVIPLMLIKNSEFGGADGQAEEAIQELAPEYEPWFQPLMEVPGSETESLLFAVQAALGAGVIGYAIGFFKGRKKNETTHEVQE
ncbi:energy-coupling factor ABC transporter substrate-binding protein [Brevibacillus halotolerans]|uniref:energy-coupling factor ABC transporter substrate-binding protein n=1 Tax=Brevibacillus TaxID=55080 RepID=UPI00215C3C6B|nr:MULTISPECIES: energy-coupling factor ABC transporter substrate-binding protein [Brevibacillus]MCR8962052.1 energy-coupling factor ABC transporter substrate-binding protein [Brevibacillus laterosporus]MCZ0834207.1 energy-coupling factor ABC transporter substrate-binding protein [Brevibacillus halotolerans]